MSLLYTRDCITALWRLLLVGFFSLLAIESAYCAAIGAYTVAEGKNIIYPEFQYYSINSTNTIDTNIYEYNKYKSTNGGHLNISPPSVSQSDSFITTHTIYSDNDIQQRIEQATLRAYAQLQQNRKEIALEEEAMLPHHCSFFRLPANAYSGDWGSSCYNAAIHTKEYTTAYKGHCAIAFSSMAGMHGLFFIGIAYCYERFYYRQREAYPQSFSFVLLSTVNSLFIFCTHSGKPYRDTSPHYTTPQHNYTQKHSLGNELVSAVTPQPYLLPVTIAHNIPVNFISTLEAL
ncbi:MAG: hypothetical protein WBK20_01890 [Spirochaetota bacterium]